MNLFNKEKEFVLKLINGILLIWIIIAIVIVFSNIVNLVVKENAVIKELTSNLQTKIKEAVKKSSDLEVKEVNVRVKNIEPVKPEIIEQ